MNQTSKKIYFTVIAIWLLLVSWQVVEHYSIRASAQTFLQNRAEAISNSLAVILRSQRRFGFAIVQYRLESALEELAQSDELQSITLLNSDSNIVAKSGELSIPINNSLTETGEAWLQNTVAFMNIVDLSVSTDLENPDEPTAVVIPITEEEEEERRRRWSPPPRPFPDGDEIGSASAGIANSSGNRDNWRRDGSRRRGQFRGPPPGMSEEEFEEFLKNQRLHSFIIELSTQNYTQTCNRDLWLRFFILGFASVAIAGGGLTWRNVKKNSELQMRLVRASEMNTHLREMNLAAAGLAHETRNPLNLVRGMAHLIYKDNQTSPEIKNQSLKITEEVDRVTAQLNEFINYSKPREPKLTHLNLNKMIREITHTLESDIEDKRITLTLHGEDLFTEADESLLRQLLFNLLLNSIQSVSIGGKITVNLLTQDKETIKLECIDDGIGISDENRSKVFQPYFTTNKTGTGLGLTVVQQIVLAHGWSIECLPARKGAIFQIRGMLRVHPNNKV